MEAIISPIVECLITPLIAPVKRHLGFLIFSGKNVTDMNAKVVQLKATAEVIKSKEEDCKGNSQVVPDSVPDWRKEFEDIEDKVGSIPTGGDGCFNIIKNKYIAGKKSSHIIKRIDDLVKQAPNIQWTDLKQIPPYKVYDDSDATEKVFKSRTLIYENVLKALSNDDTQKMAICGMGGVGKTTMMEKLRKDVHREHMFDCVVRVVIGKKTDTIAFQRDVAEVIGLPLSDTAEVVREDRLRTKFSEMSKNSTKKILIILDDVWEVVDLKVIGLSSPLPGRFKLLLTSRDEKVCINMGVGTNMINRMQGLEEDEARDLFWEFASVSPDGKGADDEFNKLGEDILKMCGGLPLAIKTIASTLKGAIKDAWKRALSRLESHDLKDLKALYDILNDIFEISYDKLETHHDKEIFLLSGLFPDDFHIPIEELMLYGWGLKLFNSKHGLVGARQQTNVSVDNLIHANLLTKSHRLGCVNMHDLARAFVLSDVSKFKQASIVNHRDKSEWPTEDTRESCKRMLLNCVGMSEIPHDFCYPNLELLMLMGDKKEILKFSEEFHTSIGKLEVITYHRMRYPLSPVSLQCSASLRTLRLRSCSLPVDISFLGDFSNLEVLSFAYCGVRKLPSTIGKLTKLKLLDLTGSIDLRIDDGVFQKLDKLEELYLGVSKGEAIRFTEDSCHGLEILSEKLSALDVEFFDNILDPKNVSFMKLERFQISMGCPLGMKWGFEYDSYSYKNTLKLATNTKELLECKVNELLVKTEELELTVKDLNHLEEILPPSFQHSFCNLEVLSVSNCADLTYLFTLPVANGMKKLERLNVSSCPVLKSLIGDKNSGVREISFPNLKRLTLKNLPDLVSLCETSIDVMELSQLTWLELYDLPSITSIFPGDNNYNSSTQLFLSKKVMIPKLETLRIIRMEKLKEIWSYSSDREEVVEDCGFRKISFPKLKSLTLKNLPDLVSLCETSIEVMELPQLMGLELEYLPNITSIFPWNNNNDISSTQLFLSKKVMIPKLKELRIRRMEKLKEIWSCSSSERDEEANNDISMLREIVMYKCDSVENVFPSNPMRLLSHFEELLVSSCGSIEVLFNIDMGKTQQLSSKSSLRRIYVSHLKMLRDVWRIKDNCNSPHHHLLISGFQAVESITIRNCKMLREVWRIKDNCNSPHHHLLISGFQAVESITIRNCKKFRNLFTPTTACFDMGALTDIIIEAVESTTARYMGAFMEIRISGCGEGSERNNGAELVEIINSQEQEYNFRNVFTPTTACFDMGALTEMDISYCGEGSERNNGAELVEIINSQEQEINNIVSEEVMIPSKVGDINTNSTSTTHVAIFPFHQLTHTFHHLRKIKFDNFKGVEVVFEIENETESSPSVNNRGELHVTTTTQQPFLFLPCLEELELWRMDDLTHVWKCNWNEFSILHNMKHQPQSSSSSFQNLTTIRLQDCKSIKYLFSPLMAKLLSNLKNIYLNNCHGMEEVVSNRDDDGHEDVEMNTTTLFPCLDRIILFSLYNLKHIGGGVATAATAKGSTSVIYDNDKFSQVGVVSWSLCQYSSHISISDCPSMVEVFEAREINNNGCSSTTTNINQGSIDTTLAVRRPNEITLLNLKTLGIIRCDQLEYVFTFSTLESLRQLEQLTIKRCNAMKVIAREENGEQTRASKVMVFPRLKSIELDELPNLAGFFLGKNGFEWPLLDFVKITDCPKMKMFTYGESRAHMLKYIHTWLGKYNLECGLNFHLTPTLQQDDDDSYNDDEEDRDDEEETPKKDDIAGSCIGSCIDNEKDSDEEEETPTKTPSPSLDGSSSCHTILQETPWSFQNLIEMNVKYNWKVTKIIPSNELLQLQKLEKIHVSGCLMVEEVFEVALQVTNSGFNESKTVVKFPNLREVKLEVLGSLKNIWKIDQWRILEFPNLTTLSIDKCKSLEYVLTFSMVGSLMQLQELHISTCKNMEVIVKEDEEEECDEKVSEIKFPCLKSLKLEHLPVLKGFCLENEDVSLPSLNTLVIKDCRELMIFTKGHLAVPELKSAETSLCPININEGEDINSFIITNKQEGLYFGDSYPDDYRYRSIF